MSETLPERWIEWDPGTAPSGPGLAEAFAKVQRNFEGTEQIVAPLSFDTIHYVGQAGEPAFGATFSNYGGAYPGVHFTRAQAVVLLGGVAQATEWTGVESRTMFTLPTGFRPGGRVLIPSGGVGPQLASDLAASAIEGVMIETNGDVVVRATDPGAGAVVVTLGGVVFRGQA